MITISRLAFAAAIIGSPGLAHPTLAHPALAHPTLAHDDGQFANVPDNVRAWFKAVKSPHGIPCCDIADGHPTEFDMRQNQYWVPINGNWTPVPPEAVVQDAGNPVGDAIVWYSVYGDQVLIRCFVPGGGT